jgi:hypothetical protein
MKEQSIRNINAVASLAQSEGAITYTGLSLDELVEYISSLYESDCEGWTLEQRAAYVVLFAELTARFDQDGIDRLEHDCSDRLEALYNHRFETLCAKVFEYEPSLLSGDDKRVLARLYTELPEYDGGLNDRSYLQWAEEFIKAEARKFAFVATVAKDHGAVIHGGIWSALRSSPFVMECSIGADDLYSEVLSLILKYADNLAEKGSARLSSRLYALARKHALFSVRKRNRRFAKILSQPDAVRAFIKETLTDEELAAIKAGEGDGQDD